MNMLRIGSISLAAVATAIAIPASADVNYNLQVFSSFTDSNSPQSISGSYNITLNSFITGNPFIQLSSFNSCTVDNAGYACASPQAFYADQYAGYDAVSWRVTQPNGNLQGPVYYFADNAFSTYGVYDTILFGSSQAARLTVSAVASGVPEPATWGMMIAGFGMVGMALRQRHRRVTAHA